MENPETNPAVPEETPKTPQPEQSTEPAEQPPEPTEPEQEEQPVEPIPKSGNKWLIALIVVIVIVIIGSGGTYYYLTSLNTRIDTVAEEDTTKIEENILEEETPNEDEEIPEVLEEETKEPENEEEVTPTEEIAIETQPKKVPRVRTAAPAEETTEQPVEEVIAATEIPGLSKCLEFKNNIPKQQCIKEIAIENKDASICNRMDIPKSGFHDVERECYIEIALMNDDISQCDGFIESIRNRIIGYSCHIYFALVKLDESYCDTIAHSDIKEYCEKRVGKLKEYPEINVQELTNTNDWDDLALQTNDPKFCEFESWIFDQQRCEEQFE